MLLTVPPPLIPPDRLSLNNLSPRTVHARYKQSPLDTNGPPPPSTLLKLSIFALDSELVIMMHMAVRHTNTDGIFTKASYPPGPFVPGINGSPLKSERAGLADATVKQFSTLNPLIIFGKLQCTAY